MNVARCVCMRIEKNLRGTWRSTSQKALRISTRLKPGFVQLKLGSLQLKLGSLQLKPGSLQLKRGSLQLKPGPLQLKPGFYKSRRDL